MMRRGYKGIRRILRTTLASVLSFLMAASPILPLLTPAGLQEAVDKTGVLVAWNATHEALVAGLKGDVSDATRKLSRETVPALQDLSASLFTKPVQKITSLIGVGAPVASASVGTDSLVGYWKLDETSAGTNAADSSGDGNTGTPNGTGGANNLPQPSTDVPTTNFTDGRSLDFDGTDDYVTAGDINAIDGASAFTFSAWIKPDAWDHGDFVMEKGNVVLIGRHDAVTGTSGGFAVQDSGANWRKAAFSIAPSLGAWHHVVGVYNGSNLISYIDGVANTGDAITSVNSTSFVFNIGGRDTTFPFDGLIDDVRIYNRALSSTEIAALAAGDHPSATWDGSSSTNYETAANWSTDAIPDPYTKVVVADVAAQPILTANVALAGLTINSGATIDLDSFNLTFNDSGTFSNSGTLILDGTQTLTGFTNDTDSGAIMVAGTANDTGLATGNSYNNLTINDGLVGYWKLDETAANACPGGANDSCDSSGYSNDGAWNGDTTASTTVPSLNFTNPRSVTFDGTGDYINLGAGASLNIAGAITMSSWVKTSSTGEMYVIGAHDNNSPYGGYGLGVGVGGNTGKLTYWSGAQGSWVASIGTVHDNAWHHVAVVVSGTTATFYIDGAVSGTPTTQQPNAYAGTRAIGGRAADGASPFNGQLDDIRVYNRALTAQEIQAIAVGNQPATSAATQTLGAALDVNGDLTLNSGTLDTASGSNYGINVAGNWYNNGGKFTPRSGTVTLDGTASGKTILSGSQAFNALTINGSGGAWTLADALDVNGGLTISAGTLDVSTGNYGVTVGGSFNNSGTFTARSGTLTLDGTSGTVDLLSGGASLYNLTVNDGGGTLTVEIEDALDVDNNLVITGGTVDTKSGENNSVTVGGNFTISDVFTARSGTVTLNGTADQTFTTGGTAFNALTLNNTASSGSDDVIISGALDVNDTFTITDGDLDISTNDPNVNVAANMIIGANGTIDTSAYSGTWTFDGTGTDVVTDNTTSGTNFRAVTVDGTSSKVLQFASGANTPTFTFTTLTIGADDVLDLNGENTTITTLVNNGTLRLVGGETVSITTMDTDSGNVLYTGTANRTGLAAGSNYYNLNLNDGLVGYWKLDETAANSCTGGSNDSCDSSGYMSDGAWNGDVASSSSVPSLNFTNARSLDFDGANDVVVAGSEPTITTNNLTVCTWVNSDVSTRADVVTRWINGVSSADQFNLLYGLNGFKPQFYISNGSSISDSGVGSTTMTIGQWHHICGTYNGSAIKVFLDGVEQSSTNATVTLDTTGVTNYRLGDNQASDGDFNGRLDDVRVYNRALTSTEISRLAAGNQSQTATATYTLTSNVDVNNSLVLSAGGLDAASGSNYGVTVGNNWENNGGVFTARSGTVTFDATDAGNTLQSGGNSFYGLTFNGVGGVWDVRDATTITNALTITNGIFDTNGKNLTATGATVSIPSGGTIRVQGGETVSGYTHDSDSGTAIYNGTGSYTTALALGNLYNHVTFNGVGGVWEPNGAVAVNGNLTITNGTFDIDGQNLTVAGTLSNDDTLRLRGSETVSATWDTNSGTTIYDGTTTFSSGLVAGDTYHNLTFNGSGGEWDLDAALDVNNNLTITAGTLDLNGFNFTVGGNLANNATISNTSSRTLTLDGATQALSLGGVTLGTLSVAGSSGTTTVGSSFSIGTLLTIAVNKTLALASYIITLIGNLTNSGSVNENTGYLGKAATSFYIADSNFDEDAAISLGSDRIYLSIVDEDGNLDGTAANTIANAVAVTCPNGAHPNDSETVTLTETGNATEVFRYTTGILTAVGDASVTANDGTLECQNGETISATFTDPQDTADTASDTTAATTDTIPTAPSNFAGTAASDTSITWTWTDNANNETGYKLYDSSNNLIATISTPNVTSYTETGLTASTSYTRKVAAYNTAGNSSYSGTAMVTTNAAPTPTPTPAASSGSDSDDGPDCCPGPDEATPTPTPTPAPRARTTSPTSPGTPLRSSGSAGQGSLADLASRPSSITQIIEQIERGETPTRAPESLQLAELAKQAQVRLQKQGVNLVAFLQQLMPNSWLERLDAMLAQLFGTMRTALAQWWNYASTRLASVFGFGTDQLLALQVLFQRSAAEVALQQRLVAETLKSQVGNVTDQQAEQLAGLLHTMRSQRQLNDQVWQERLRAEVLALSDEQVRVAQQLAARFQDGAADRLRSQRQAVIDQLQGLPYVVGRAVTLAQYTGTWARDMLVAGRRNRLMLAQETDSRLTQAGKPLRLAWSRARLSTLLAWDGLRGAYDEPLAITDVTIEELADNRVVISWRTTRVTSGKVNWGESLTYGAEGTGGEAHTTDLDTFHRVEINSLTPTTRIYFEVVATDAQSRSTADAYYSFVTPAKEER